VLDLFEHGARVVSQALGAQPLLDSVALALGVGGF
jgi:hypothetical protein